jgi:glycosyltransferase involved in cell wall biosynthesis
MAMQVILDVSRLLICAGRATPSGIDRVELAYALRWLHAPAGSCAFVAQGLRSGFAVLPHGLVADLAAALQAAWSGEQVRPESAHAARALAMRARGRLVLGLGRGALAALLRNGRRTAFLLVSHRMLERQGPIEEMRRAGAAFVPLIHDIIPVTHPEYARAGQAEKHRRRMASAGALSDGVIVNSEATAEALRPWMQGGARTAPILVAPLGIGTGAPHPAAPAAAHDEPPYFVSLGTIEPRKNHLLLLHLWRDMAAARGAAAPRLVIVGRRGWENENIVDILERCTALDGLVQEAGQLSDRQVTALVRGARALLFPSFAEGYGLPLAEALALGTPAVCSDLPALREVGAAVPEYLDPLDGAAWRDAVQDYAAPGSPRRDAQLARMSAWRAPTWEEHFALVDDLLAQVTAPRALAGAAAAAAAMPAQAALPTRPAPWRPLPSRATHVAVRDQIVSPQSTS